MRIFNINKPIIFICSGLLAIMIIIGYLLHHYSILDWIDTIAIGNIIANLGWFGVPAFIVFGAAFTSIGFPRQLVAFVGGYVFGIFIGVLLGTIAAVIGAMLSFYFSRGFAGPWVRRKYPQLAANIDRFIRDKLFLKVLLIRFLPLGTNLATNLVAGAAATPAHIFALASFIGYIPQMVIFVFIGNGIRIESNTQLIVATILFLISMIIGGYLYRQRNNHLVTSSNRED